MKTDQGNTNARLVNRQIVLTPSLIEKLDAEAARLTMSRSLLVRMLCEEGLRQRNAEDVAVL